MTQLQTRETAQTPSEPVSPLGQESKWTAFVVVGVIALLAAAFGVAIWANSDSGTANQPEVGAVSNSVEIVQNEIDKAVAAAEAEPSLTAIIQDAIDKAPAGAQAEPSSVEIVQNEIDKALAAAEAEPSSVEIVQNEIDKALAAAEAELRAATDDAASFGEKGSTPTPDRARQWTPYWPLEAERNVALAAQARQWTPYWVTQAEFDAAHAAANSKASTVQAVAPVDGFEPNQEATSIHLNTGMVTGEYYGNSGELYPALPVAAATTGFDYNDETTTIHLDTGMVTGEYYGNSGELYPALSIAAVANGFDYNPDGGLDAVSFGWESSSVTADQASERTPDGILRRLDRIYVDS